MSRRRPPTRPWTCSAWRWPRRGCIEPLQKRSLAVKRGALVIGAGLAGMVAATELSAQGFDVHLVEREEELGGSLRRVRYLLNGEKPREELAALM